jgi:hypothetical protein
MTYGTIGAGGAKGVEVVLRQGQIDSASTYLANGRVKRGRVDRWFRGVR